MPTIVTRAGWGARAPAYTIAQTSWPSRTGFVVHYSAASKTQTVRAIQDYHIGKGWGDVGYNWLVTVDGRIWEGRSGTWNAVGAHVAGHNTANIGVCMIGADADVTAAAKTSIRWLYEQANRFAGKTLAKRYHSGMSGANTSCPGNNLRGWVLAGMPTTPAPTPAPEEETMFHGQIPAGSHVAIICTPYDKSGISFGCDFGKAKLRVAEHIVNVGWRVQEVVIDSADLARKDLAVQTNCDRRCIMRTPLDANDPMTTPVGYIAWW